MIINTENLTFHQNEVDKLKDNITNIQAIQDYLIEKSLEGALNNTEVSIRALFGKDEKNGRQYYNWEISPLQTIYQYFFDKDDVEKWDKTSRFAGSLLFLALHEDTNQWECIKKDGKNTFVKV